MYINTLKNNYLKIFLIILITILLDNLYISSIHNPPAWDQGYHLSNAFKMSNILESKNIGFFNKINDLLNITDSYRGPITYFLSGLFLKIFKNSYYFAYLSNNIFNSICIISIFLLGKLYKNDSVGIWASLIFTFSSFIVLQRSDYLIDLSLTSFTTLNLLFLSKWYLNKKKGIFAIASGISLALVFLVKPTGVTFFILPIIIIFIKIFRNKIPLTLKIYQVLLFLLSFTIFIYPWFSRHWLTIITSTINAWNWGINYQDGFEKWSLENWIYYFKNLPAVFGKINFYIFLNIFLFDNLFGKNLFRKRNINFNKIQIWFWIYILNCYLILSFMSTKDIRFILPAYPIVCIYLASFINTLASKFFTINIKKIILVITISISLFFDNGLKFKNFNSDFLSTWPHSEIIREIKNKNINLTSTLAILPDTKEINTFNLEAEASRQGEYVSVRQIISNENTYKEDLKFFDWFLVKSGEQGAMSSKSKNLLNKYLLDNNSFITHKEWLLNDKSILKLIRRKTINSSLSQIKCLDKYPNLRIKQIKSGININLIGKGEDLKSGNLLVDFIEKDFKKFTNISLANDSYDRDFNKKSCYSLSQNISMEFPETFSGKYSVKADLLSKEGNIIPLKMFNNEINIEKKLFDSDYIQMANRISEVETLGMYLRKGEYKNLFDLVGIINQSDPKQTYLTNAEKIYTQRFKENKDLKHLYSILISQILQRKISKAEKTINLIIKSEFNNGNAYLAQSIINLYLIDRKEARVSIENAKLFDKSKESEEILNIIDGLNYLLEMQFINAYKTFSL